jgi:hypothetical protein
MDAVVRLREALNREGASLVRESRDGAFAEEIYQVGHTMVELAADYGVWRVNVGFEEESLYPASFWIAALDGETAYPDPAAVESDVDRLADRLSIVLHDADRLLPVVADMGVQYTRMMHERFSR